MTSESDPALDEAYDLFEKTIEASLSPEENERLQQLLSQSPAVRKTYLQYMHLNACLHWKNVPVSEADNYDFVEAAGMSEPSQRFGWLRGSMLTTAMLVGLAASLLFLISGMLMSQRGGTNGQGASPLIATLVETKGCSWGDSSLPTAQGSALTEGTFRLILGMATLKFESGALVTIEAPVELELVDPMNCRLIDGTLVADIPPQAKGFRVSTQSAILVDQGTSFGVVVDQESGLTDVQVFEGIVDVAQRSTLKKQRMETGERAFINDVEMTQANEADEELSSEDFSTETEDPFEQAITVTTEVGRGKVGYLINTNTTSAIFDKRLVVKTSHLKSRYDSSAWLSFDLESLGQRRVNRARIELDILPSSRGYASLVPDATFAIYGIVGEVESDEGQAQRLSKPTSFEGVKSPLNTIAQINGVDTLTGPAGLPVEVTLLGRFVVPQGMESGLAIVDDPALVQFVNDFQQRRDDDRLQDHDQLLTVLLIRETSETGLRGLSHTFARGTPYKGVSPTLRLIAE